MRRATLGDAADYQHGPSRATRTIIARVACPQCGADLDVDEAAVKVSPTGRQRIVRAALCTGCEFVHEF